MDFSYAHDDGLGFLPPCFARLRNTSTTSYHIERDLRAPKAIFSVSFGKCTNQLETVIQTYKKIKSAPSDYPNTHHNAFLKEYESMYYVLAQYIEDCKKVARVFCRPNQRYRKNPYVKKFEKAIEKYEKEYACLIANKLKHDQSSIRMIDAKSGFIRVKGFFVERYNAKDGSDYLGPHPLIHSKNPEAISFNRDIRINVYQVHKVGWELDKLLYNLGVNSDSNESVDIDEQALNVIQETSDLPSFVYPGETKFQYHDIKRMRPDDNYRFRFIHNSSAYNDMLKLGRKQPDIRYIFGGDGATQIFKYPNI